MNQSIHSHDFICSFNNLLSSGILVFLLHLIYNFSHVLRKKSTEKYSANNDKKTYKFVILIAEKFKAALVDSNRSEMMYSSCESELLTPDEDLTIMTQSMTLIEADVILNKVSEEVKFFP